MKKQGSEPQPLESLLDESKSEKPPEAESQIYDNAEPRTADMEIFSPSSSEDRMQKQGQISIYMHNSSIMMQ